MTLTGHEPFKGYVYSISDSSITITSKEVLFHGLQTPSSSTTENTFNFNDIKSISLKRRNRAGNGFLIGALTGAVLGGAISASLLKPSAHAAIVSSAGAATIGGVLFGLIGGLVGRAIGSAHDESFRIAGDYQNFKKVKSYFAP
jgi:hypothetical protein